MPLGSFNLAQSFVDAWIDSSSHYQIMMTDSHGYMGVGVARNLEDFMQLSTSDLSKPINSLSIRRIFTREKSDENFRTTKLDQNKKHLKLRCICI